MPDDDQTADTLAHLSPAEREKLISHRAALIEQAEHHKTAKARSQRAEEEERARIAADPMRIEVGSNLAALASGYGELADSQARDHHLEMQVRVHGEWVYRIGVETREMQGYPGVGTVAVDLPSAIRLSPDKFSTLEKRASRMATSVLAVSTRTTYVAASDAEMITTVKQVYDQYRGQIPLRREGLPLEYVAPAPRPLDDILRDYPRLSDAARTLLRNGTERDEAKAVQALVSAGAHAHAVADVLADPYVGPGKAYRESVDRDLHLAEAVTNARAAQRDMGKMPQPDVTTLDAYLSAVLHPRYRAYLRGSDEKKHMATLVELVKHKAPPGAILAAAQVVCIGRADHEQASEKLFRKALYVAQQARSKEGTQRPTPAVRDSRAAGMER